MISVAIDGPSGAGKSTLARRLAGELGYVYVDTGAMYRSIGLYVMENGGDLQNEQQVTAMLPDVHIRLCYENGTQHILLGEKDVSTAIREEKVGMAASSISGYPAVRAFLLETQRNLAKTQNVLMDGRDIGTVVLPDATVKIYLTASSEARAHRRQKELLEKGMEADFATVLADIEQRDWQDMHRAAAPLRKAEDAVLVDTSDLNFDESFEALKKVILDRVKEA